MTFVITQNCCNDGSCVLICPVDCIRPVPASSGSATTMLYIDPVACVDCGACMAECPVGAIYYEDDLPIDQEVFRGINADYFTRHPLRARAAEPAIDHHGVEPGSLRVAVVGSGPAAGYAVAELMRSDGVEASVFERLPTPYGLVRAGVAPDHGRTKDVTSVFEPALGSAGVRCYFNVEVGKDISHEELLAHHHAVIYAVGASGARSLGIAGEELVGSVAASDVVAWYNGHPDHRDDDIDLSGERAVIIGNGNVALDVARVLLGDTERLAATDIADHALRALTQSSIREVAILGRRSVADAAFSMGELLALGELPGVDLVIEGELGPRPVDDFEGALKYDTAMAYRQRPAVAGHKRLVLRFSTAPAEILGTERVQGLRLNNGDVIDTSLVLRSIGYRGAPIVGLPFDDERGVVPNDAGRVSPGVYVTGWIKRGPRGVIGTNRTCAQETLATLWEDFRHGRLVAPSVSEAVDDVLAGRGIRTVDWQGWQRIDDVERRNGAENARPRAKFVAREDMLAAALS